MVEAIDIRPLKLRPRERQVLHFARYAREACSTGYALVSPNQIKSAERLISRGFLTKAPTQVSPLIGLSVLLTEENLEAIASASIAALRSAA